MRPALADIRLSHAGIAQVVLLGVLLVGCWLVLRPFLTAVIFAVVVAVSTWSMYERLLKFCGGRLTVSSVVMTVAVVLLALLPTAFLIMTLADGMALIVGWLRALPEQWMADVPVWIERIPLIGAELAQNWRQAAEAQTQLSDFIRAAIQPMQQLVLLSGRHVGNAILQGFFAVLLLYFLYRNGPALVSTTQRAAQWVGGTFAVQLLTTIRHSLVGVAFGVVGAGLAQALVASVGYTIAGLPSPILLGALTFMLSIVPFGPPLLWGGAAIWLAKTGSPGWAVFMLVYGFFVISSVDNVIKPLIISHTNHLAFALTFMGVIGGLIAFGVMGVFIGPALLAVAISVFKHTLGWQAGKGS